MGRERVPEALSSGDAAMCISETFSGIPLHNHQQAKPLQNEDN